MFFLHVLTSQSTSYKAILTQLLIMELISHFQYADSVNLKIDTRFDTNQFEKLEPDVFIVCNDAITYDKLDDYHLVTLKDYCVFQLIEYSYVSGHNYIELFILNIFGTPIKIYTRPVPSSALVREKLFLFILSFNDIEWFAQRPNYGDNLYFQMYDSFKYEFSQLTLDIIMDGKYKDWNAFNSMFTCELVNNEVIKVIPKQKYIKNNKYFIRYLNNKKPVLLLNSLDKYPHGTIKGIRHLNKDWYLSSNK